MHVLVTGATGQLGRPLCAALRDAGHSVTGLGRDPQRLAALTGLGVRALAADLRDDKALDAALAPAPPLPPIDAVLHLAGGVRGAGALTADVLNREGTARLLAALARAPNLPPPKIVYASTCAVYGDRNGLWLTESYAPAPHTAYGASKLAAEQLLLAPGAPPAVIGRLAAVYGPGMRMMLTEEMQKGRAFLPGEGQNFLPLVHIDDAVAALIRLLDAGVPGQIYHIAGRATPQLREFYKLVHARSGGTPVRFWSTWIPSAFQRRAADLNERLQARLNRRPRFTNDQLKLWTAGVRLKTDRLEKELGFVWKHPDVVSGLGPDTP